jgi:hypothetical protein
MSASTLLKLDRRHHYARRLAGLVVVLLAGMGGCYHSDSLPSVSVYEVKGKVLLADGSPLSEGWVYFVPKGDLSLTPSGSIGSDGTFSVVTGGSGDGAPAGDYKLRVESPRLQQAATTSKKKPPFPAKYGDEDSSGLVVTVRAESNQLEPIRLK